MQALLEDVERMRRDLAALCKIGNEIHAELSLRPLLKMVVDALLDAVHAERGIIVLPHQASGELQPVVVRPRSALESLPDAPISLPLVRECMHKRITILSGGPTANGHRRSVLCAPLGAQGRPFGAIYLDAPSDRQRFDEHDLEILTVIARQASLALHRTQLIEELERMFLGTVHTLVDIIIETKDTYTYGHSKRVSEFARLTALELRRDPDEVEQIKLAGLLHDIGKLDFSADILSNEGELTKKQREQIRNHPQLGANIIEQIGSARLAKVKDMVRHHHERVDGTGYPDGLKGDKIPYGARVLAVADSYDAIVSLRLYRETRTAEQAISELRDCADTQFDPEIVEAFVRARGKWLAD